MAVLSALRAAAPYIGIEVPASVYGSQEREHVELAELANEAAQVIAEAHDWQALKKLHSIKGDGTSTDFALPFDYKRLPKNQDLWTTEQETPMTHVLDHNDWLELQVRDFELVIRAWTILGGRLHTRPAIDVTETISFYYQRDTIVQLATGSLQAEFRSDTDRFVLSERILKLAVIWMWRSVKGLDYAEDMENYEIALAKEIASDKGPRILHMGRATYPRDVSIAYPRSIRP